MTDEERKEYHRQYSKERYKWLKNHRICTKCGSDDAIERSNLCPECSYKDWLRHYENYQNLTAEQKQQLIQEAAARRKKIEETRNANNLCIGCGKPKEQPTKKHCNVCLSKMRNYYYKYRENKGIKARELLDGVNFCQKCGKQKPLEGFKLCQKCYDSNINHLAKTPTHNGKRVDNYFTQTMSSFFNQK